MKSLYCLLIIFLGSTELYLVATQKGTTLWNYMVPLNGHTSYQGIGKPKTNQC